MCASFSNPAVSGLDLLNLFPPVLQPCFPLPQGLVLYSASLQAHQYQQEFHTASDFHSSVIQLYFLGAGYEVCTALQQVVLCGGMGSKTLSSDVNLYCHQHGKRGSTIALSSIGVTQSSLGLWHSGTQRQLTAGVRFGAFFALLALKISEELVVRVREAFWTLWIIPYPCLAQEDGTLLHSKNSIIKNW